MLHFFRDKYVLKVINVSLLVPVEKIMARRQIVAERTSYFCLAR